MVQGGGEIGNQVPHVSLPMEWFDWQGTYSALLKVPFCLAVGNRFLICSRISWMDEFSDWKRPNPIPGHFIFPVSSSLANSPLRCSSCEIQFIKQDVEDVFSLRTFNEALGHRELVVQTSSLRE